MFTHNEYGGIWLRVEGHGDGFELDAFSCLRCRLRRGGSLLSVVLPPKYELRLEYGFSAVSVDRWT